MDWSAVGKPISIPLLCLSLHIRSIFGFAADHLPLLLNSVVESGYQQLLSIQMHRIISLFQPPGFQRRDPIDQGWVMCLIPGLISCGQGIMYALGEHGKTLPKEILWGNGEAVRRKEGVLGKQIFKRCPSTASEKTFVRN